MTDSPLQPAKPPSDSEERQDEKWYDRTRYQVLLFVGGIVLFVLVGGWILHWYIEPRTSGQKKDLVQALGLLTAGVAGAVGIFFTWRGQRITQESLQDTRENSEENLRLAREGQITERFTRAIDQLGATDEANNKKLELRLGGIYALERIAGDSLAMENSPGRDYSTVMEVLAAYVRENTPQAPGPSKGSSDEASTSNEATTEADEGAEQAASPEPGRPTADIQAILDVLSRTQARTPEEYRTSLDLHEANLQGANLEGAILVGTNLQGASLQKANLRGANLQKANLQKASLRKANLSKAILYQADLQEADLQEAHLWGANLQAILAKANLQGAVLWEANLEGAILWEANLQGAELIEANLQKADLQEKANLQYANLRGADLHQANLQYAELQGADLHRANLQEADLQEATVTDEQLAEARSMKGATMPNSQKYEEWLKDPGQLHTTKFEPALSYDISGGWKRTTETTAELFLEGPEERGQLIFTNPLHVFDPSNLSELKELPEPENADEWVSWFQSHPNLDTSKPVPVSVGGASGKRIDVTYASTPENYRRDFCGEQPCVPLYPTSESGMVSFDGWKDRFVIVEVRGEMVLIDVTARADKFEDFLPKAQKMLDTVEWKSP